MFIIQFSGISGIFKNLFKSFEIKNVSFIILFIFQNLEKIKIIILLNVVKCNCRLQMQQMTMSKQSTSNSIPFKKSLGFLVYLVVKSNFGTTLTFFNCCLPASHPTLGHCRGEVSLAQCYSLRFTFFNSNITGRLLALLL